VIACNADRAVVVVRRVFMVVRYYHERGGKKQQNEKNSKALVPEHGSPFTYKISLNYANEFVKILS